MDSFSIDVLDTRRERDLHIWQDLVEKSPLRDVYYRPGYVLACQEAEPIESACALLIDAAGFKVLLPLLIADLSHRNCGQPGVGRHAYTPYGYGGLLQLGPSGPPSPYQIDALRNALLAWGRDNNIVCVLLRQDPLQQPLPGPPTWFETCANDDIVLVRSGVTTAIDLTAWNEEMQCISSLSKGRRSDLKFARAKLRVSWTRGCDAECIQSLRVFQVLYNRAMTTLGAAEFFFFPERYYEALAKGLGEQLAVGIAWAGDAPVAGALFMLEDRNAHYHLSASNDDGRRLKAGTLLIDQAAELARHRCCNALHLGGGVKGEDTLLRFKQSFGGGLFNSTMVTVIADQQQFRELCATRNTPWPFSMHVAYNAMYKSYSTAVSPGSSPRTGPLGDL